MKQEKTVCVKIGGRAASRKDKLAAFARETAEACRRANVVVIHGGGADVTRVSRVFGLEAVFVDGVRMTSPEEMEIVDMVLSGSMNKYLVRTFSAHGVPAVGISGSDGGTFTGKPVAPDTCTGTVTDANPELLITLLNAGYVPVVSSTSMQADGSPLNINADEVALALAVALRSDGLIFVSDIPGILKESNVIKRLGPQDVEHEIEEKVITGGMIPKVRASVDALNHGVSRIVIGEYTEDGDLTALMNGIKGTTIDSLNR